MPTGPTHLTGGALAIVCLLLGSGGLQAWRPAGPDVPEAGRAARGLVLAVDAASLTLTVSCQELLAAGPDRPPMPAGVRTLLVSGAAALDGLQPGMTIDFTLIPEAVGRFRAEEVRVKTYENHEQEPSQLRRLRLLDRLVRLVNPGAGDDVVPVGRSVPDFTLIDQQGGRVALSALAGQVVAVTFAYIRCPNPAYCFTLASNFGQLQRRFDARLGRDIALLTIVLDPEHDRDGALADYARIWTARPEAWRFLTGDPPDVRRASRLFGVDAWNDEGLVIHSFNTAVIDRRGVLAASLEGNRFTGRQLGDLVQTILDRP
jgi:protein SCO1/2